MNKKGFTLVEVLVVVVIFGLILGIAVPGVVRAGKRAKEKSLLSKVESLEKTAIIYGQQPENKIKFTDETCEICNGIRNCYCFNESLKVNDLIVEELIKPDDESGNINNPTDNTKTLNDCTITLYKKYGKIYASYDNKIRGNECWAAR